MDDPNKGEFEFWPRVVNVESLIPVETTLNSTRFIVDESKVPPYRQVDIDTTKNARNSTSLMRAPATEDFVRGNRKNVPFLPGGFNKVHHQREGDTLITGYKPLQGKGFSADAFATSQGDLTQVPPGLDTVVCFDVDGSLAAETEEEQEEAARTLSVLHNRTGLMASLDGNASAAAAAAPQQKQGSRGTHNRVQPVTTEEFKALLGNTAPIEELLAVETEEDMEVEEDKGKGKEEVSAQNEQQQAAPRKQQEWAVMTRMDMSNFNELVPDLATGKYPFELDVFQKEAIYHLERGESVFIAAHTSAGKTIIAEYAIALSRKHLTRTIYTSPIKSLSNQKFRDFQKKFGDVGLITGDVQIKTDAACLIMTTEILRSMLYRGADMIRDVEWVIFDECHYVSDPDRGVVWEEVIILLPQHVNLVFLSATIPNTQEFAEWVGRIKRKKIHVISTQRRPVPLEHFLWAGKELHKIVDAKGTFNRAAYESANDALKKKMERQQTKKSAPLKVKLDKTPKSLTNTMTHGQKLGSELSQINSMVQYLREQDLLPLVVFIYSKKQCEKIGFGLQHLDLTTPAEKKQIRSFFDASVARLNGSDRRLPQILRIKELLTRGLGVHHGGILPLVKEVIEILFGRGLVKVLFATETFAMGLNMPARSVVFSSLRKHDGTAFRDLNPGEFLQASGRAGRRGIDASGVVIIACFHEVPDISLLKRLVVGKAERLVSQFRLTYNSILNFLRVEDFGPEDMMQRSFSEAVNQRHVPEQRAMLGHALKELRAMPEQVECIFGSPEAIEEYHHRFTELRAVDAEQIKLLLARFSSQLLVPGRVVLLLKDDVPAVIVQQPNVTQRDDTTDTMIKVFVSRMIPPAGTGEVGLAGGELKDVNAVQELRAVSSLKIPVDVGSVLAGRRSALADLARALDEATAGGGGVPLVDPVTQLKVNDLDFVTRWRSRTQLAGALQASACSVCTKRDEHFAFVERRTKLEETVARLRLSTSSEGLYLMPEFYARLRVLEKLEYIDRAKNILIKGRVAREVNSCDELIATELIFENLLTTMEPAEAMAVLSMLVFEENNSEPGDLNATLVAAKKTVEALAKTLGRVQVEAGLDLTVNEYVKSRIKPGLMHVVYEWCNGVSFADICQLTETQEGSIVRHIIRLEETAREIRSIARVLGDNRLFEAMEQASTLMKRDIVFASSLYLSGPSPQDD